MKKLMVYGIKEELYHEMDQKLSIQFKEKAKPLDIIWGVMNRIVVMAIKDGDLNALKMIYYNQALFLNETERDCIVPLRESTRISLIILQNRGFTKVKILKQNSCNICQQFADKIYSISEALEKMPIPCPDCQTIIFKGSSGFCRCIYIPTKDA